MEFTICIAGLKYKINCLTERFYKNSASLFECPESGNEHCITVTEDALRSSQHYDDTLSTYANETVYLLNEVICHCLDYDRMIIHGAAISYNDGAYLFVAPSGTGKTTHIGLWRKYLQDKVEIINGDKPMLEFGDEIIVHGTPWNGKEGLGTNTSAPLKAIIVLHQSQSNSFRKLNAVESVSSLLRQCFYSIDREFGPKVIPYIGRLVNEIPVYSLECDVSRDAFETCFEGLKSSSSAPRLPSPAY